MNKLCLSAVIVGLSFSAAPVRALEEDQYGTLNPQELTMDYYVGLAKAEHFNPQMCIFGYPAAKMGNHPLARLIFERCSKAGIVATMPWMAWQEENGYDKPSNPAEAARWDKATADHGSAIGDLNYGLDLLRGHGVAHDEILGRAYVDRAAKAGDATAKELVRNGYDPMSVTPDADKNHYRDPNS